jgi:hypothetical protein
MAACGGERLMTCDSAQCDRIGGHRSIRHRRGAEEGTRARPRGRRRQIAWELINQPSLNIPGLSSGRIGEQAAHIIPATTTASLDLRLVKGVTARYRASANRATTSSRPIPTTRRGSLIRALRGSWRHGTRGYNAMRTPTDPPLAQRGRPGPRASCPRFELRNSTRHSRCRRIWLSHRIHRTSARAFPALNRKPAAIDL